MFIELKANLNLLYTDLCNFFLCQSLLKITRLQFVVLHFKNKVTNITGSADTYKGSFALF